MKHTNQLLKQLADRTIFIFCVYFVHGIPRTKQQPQTLTVLPAKLSAKLPLIELHQMRCHFYAECFVLFCSSITSTNNNLARLNQSSHANFATHTHMISPPPTSNEPESSHPRPKFNYARRQASASALASINRRCRKEQSSSPMHPCAPRPPPPPTHPICPNTAKSD